MKTKITGLLIILFTVFVSDSFAQTARERLMQTGERKSSESSIGLTTRAAQMNRTQTTDVSDAKWMREIYRYLDLSKEGNAPLYYPVMPEEGRMNLFTMIFKLLAEGHINAYEYLDGREIFTDEFKIDFQELLDRFGIYYTTANGNIVVEDVDIPSNEVQGYYLKEAYFFETGTSNYGVEPLAVCPIIHRQGDYEASTVRYPLFWIPYEEIRPYALRMPIMTSSLNNTMTGTIDDFFRKNNYDGEIYKTTNLRNLAVAQYASTPEEMKAEQEKIEQQLKHFEDNLWRENTDTTTVQQEENQSRRILRPRRSSIRRNNTSSSSSSSAPARSSATMRDRRY